MKANIFESVKIVLNDRLMTILVALLVLASLAYCVYVGISLRPSDLQVAVHYTAFGGTSFYREKWYYLISFIVFGGLIAVVNSAISIKLYTQGRRQIALLFVWLSFLILVIAWLMTRAVLRIAFL